MNKIWIVVSIFLMVLGVTGFVLAVYEDTMGEEPEFILKEVPCYDKFNNMINNVTCTEKDYQYPIFHGAHFHRELAFISIIILIIGMTIFRNKFV